MQQSYRNLDKCLKMKELQIGRWVILQEEDLKVESHGSVMLAQDKSRGLRMQTTNFLTDEEHIVCPATNLGVIYAVIRAGCGTCTLPPICNVTSTTFQEPKMTVKTSQPFSSSCANSPPANSCLSRCEGRPVLKSVKSSCLSSGPEISYIVSSAFNSGLCSWASNSRFLFSSSSSSAFRRR